MKRVVVIVLLAVFFVAFGIGYLWIPVASACPLYHCQPNDNYKCGLDVHCNAVCPNGGTCEYVFPACGCCVCN